MPSLSLWMGCTGGLSLASLVATLCMTIQTQCLREFRKKAAEIEEIAVEYLAILGMGDREGSAAAVFKQSR